MKKKAAIVGAGVMGSAMTWPLSDNGYEVSLIGTHLDGEIIQSCKDSGFHPRLRRQLPDQVAPYFIEEIETALNGVDFIVSGVSSAGARWIGQTIGPIIKPESKVITITKGLELSNNGELIILPEVMRGEFPLEIRDGVSIAAVGGPCIAGELAGRRQSCVYFGCREIETARFFADIFRTDYYHIFTTNDIVGLEIAVALKNAYALGVGLANGLLKKQNGPDRAGAYMHNMGAALFAQACIEIKIVLECMQANSDFAFSLPGAGDLFVTSQAGRSVTLGRLLGEGKSYTQALEELAGKTLESAMVIKKMGKAIPMMEKNGMINSDDLPFMRLLVNLILHENPLEIHFDHFFSDVII
jgi:glycerol-3-phosphate dehydrogenase (NAD(P)+)